MYSKEFDLIKQMKDELFDKWEEELWHGKTSGVALISHEKLQELINECVKKTHEIFFWEFIEEL